MAKRKPAKRNDGLHVASYRLPADLVRQVEARAEQDDRPIGRTVARVLRAGLDALAAADAQARTAG